MHLSSLPVPQRKTFVIWNTCCVCDNSYHTIPKGQTVERIHDLINYWNCTLKNEDEHWILRRMKRRRLEAELNWIQTGLVGLNRISYLWLQLSFVCYGNICVLV